MGWGESMHGRTGWRGRRVAAINATPLQGLWIFLAMEESAVWTVSWLVRVKSGYQDELFEIWPERKTKDKFPLTETSWTPTGHYAYIHARTHARTSLHSPSRLCPQGENAITWWRTKIILLTAKNNSDMTQFPSHESWSGRNNINLYKAYVTFQRSNKAFISRKKLIKSVSLYFSARDSRLIIV